MKKTRILLFILIISMLFSVSIITATADSTTYFDLKENMSVHELDSGISFRLDYIVNLIKQKAVNPYSVEVKDVQYYPVYGLWGYERTYFLITIVAQNRLGGSVTTSFFASDKSSDVVSFDSVVMDSTVLEQRNRMAATILSCYGDTKDYLLEFYNIWTGEGQNKPAPLFPVEETIHSITIDNVHFEIPTDYYFSAQKETEFNDNPYTHSKYNNAEDILDGSNEITIHEGIIGAYDNQEHSEIEGYNKEVSSNGLPYTWYLWTGNKTYNIYFTTNSHSVNIETKSEEAFQQIISTLEKE